MGLIFFPCTVNPSVPSAGVYETECEIRKKEWIEETTTTSPTTETIARARTIKFVEPQCQPDGKYHRVQNYGNKKFVSQIIFDIIK